MGLVALADVHDHLNIPAADTTHDVELQGFIDAVSSLIVYSTGPMSPLVITGEVHHEAAGRDRIVLYETPVISVQQVVEYVGPQARPLTSQPLGSASFDNYGYDLPDLASGVVYRRIGSGLLGTFFGYVTVSYTAGYQALPADVRLAVLEDIRGLYQVTQQGGRPAFGQNTGAGEEPAGVSPTHLFPRVQQLLARTRRVQGIA